MNETHRNNFDFIRFLAATMVWYDHCYVIAGLPDPLSSRLQLESFGSLGVAIFFIISGYFVTASYGRRSGLLAFIRNRLLRICPALAVVVLLSVFVLGPCVTSLSLSQYFSHPETWRYLETLLILPLQYVLPGVFHHSSNFIVNGSLWTLPQEIKLYFFVALLGVLGLLRPRVAFLLFAVLCALRLNAVFMKNVFGDSLYDYFWHLNWWQMALLVKPASLFAGGALMYLARDRIALKLPFFIVAVLSMLVSVYLPHARKLLFEIALIYAVIYLGFLKLPLLPSFGKWGDFSYGMYIYAYPIQQLSLQLLGYSGNFTTFLITSFIATLFCAVLSWHYVERPALRLKTQ